MQKTAWDSTGRIGSGSGVWRFEVRTNELKPDNNLSHSQLGAISSDTLYAKRCKHCLAVDKKGKAFGDDKHSYYCKLIQRIQVGLL